ncbi:MAG TPA: alpha-hydroxy acid oxidase [Acidimicrobiales bacterium]|nr:alpha-hydroxy acid oxidase [Acidimicrobiales bacterium]
MGIGEQRAAARIGTVTDARRLARRRLPGPVWDYIEGGAGAETTAQANIDAFAQVEFRPRVAATRGSPAPDLRTTVLGTDVSMPLLLSPVGFTRMMDPAGDVAAARAAGAAGTVVSLSTLSGHSIAEVGAAASGPAWFQLYLLGGRAGAEQLVDRAKRAGYRALLVTVDTQVPGNRERDLRHGLSPPLRLDRRTVTKMIPYVVHKPRWLLDAARDRFQLELVNASSLSLDGKRISAADALFHWIASPARWEDFAWLRAQWDGPIAAKGVLTGDDARRAIDAGADAVIVSNHGGRQLDTVAPTAAALVEVVNAVGDRTEVLMDGGIRRGADVVKAVAAGGQGGDGRSPVGLRPGRCGPVRGRAGAQAPSPGHRPDDALGRSGHGRGDRPQPRTGPGRLGALSANSRLSSPGNAV